MLDIGTGQPILLIHGLGSHSGYFQNLMNLTAEYRLLAFDLLGHGANKTSENITLNSMAKHQWDLLDIHGCYEVTLVGHSLGGLVALEMFKQQPHRVKNLILANTYAYALLGVNDLVYLSRWIDFNILTTTAYLDGILRNGLYDYGNQYLRKEAKKAFYIRKDTYLDACRAGAFANYYSLLSKINVPTLIIGSSHDQVIKLIVQEDMHNKISGSKFVVIQRCGHLSGIEKPAEFYGAIQDFLGGRL